MQNEAYMQLVTWISRKARKHRSSAGTVSNEAAAVVLKQLLTQQIWLVMHVCLAFSYNNKQYARVREDLLDLFQAKNVPGEAVQGKGHSPNLCWTADSGLGRLVADADHTDGNRGHAIPVHAVRGQVTGQSQYHRREKSCWPGSPTSDKFLRQAGPNGWLPPVPKAITFYKGPCCSMR